MAYPNDDVDTIASFVAAGSLVSRARDTHTAPSVTATVTATEATVAAAVWPAPAVSKLCQDTAPTASEARAVTLIRAHKPISHPDR